MRSKNKDNGTVGKTREAAPNAVDAGLGNPPQTKIADKGTFERKTVVTAEVNGVTVFYRSVARRRLSRSIRIF
jgi:hypothetical protein